MKEKVSFIIPALNEEKIIGNLIANLKKLGKEWDYEIIVADNNSNDKTAIIAEKMGAIVVKTSEYDPKTIANVRNTGAHIASGKLFIFCDADTEIKDPDSFLARVFSVFQDPEIIAGVPSLSVFPDESTRNDKIFHYFFNNIFRISFIMKSPVCGGQCQIVKADSFWEVGGYDGYIVHSEDSDLFRRLSKTGKLHFFSDLVVYESPRRYRYYGYIKLLLKGVYSYIYQLIFRKNFFDEWRKIEYN